MRLCGNTARVVAAARCLSLFGHPFVLLPATLTLALLRRVPPARLILIVATFLLAIVLPLVVLIWRNVARGKWSDTDVSDKAQRPQLYLASIAVLVCSIAVFWILRLPRPVIVGSVISLLLLVVTKGITARSKLSMHSMFAAFCSLILLAVNAGFSFAFVVVLIAVGWSRITLRRHTIGQVALGAFAGAVAGATFLLLTKH
jgi:membrane-associated phospholipid phosphatase